MSVQFKNLDYRRPKTRLQIYGRAFRVQVAKGEKLVQEYKSAVVAIETSGFVQEAQNEAASISVHVTLSVKYSPVLFNFTWVAVEKIRITNQFFSHSLAVLIKSIT